MKAHSRLTTQRVPLAHVIVVSRLYRLCYSISRLILALRIDSLGVDCSEGRVGPTPIFNALVTNIKLQQVNVSRAVIFELSLHKDKD